MKMTATTRHFGYWIFGKDMPNVNLSKLKSNGVTDVFLNFYAVTAHGTSKVESWVAQANKNNIGVHIWVQCFYDGDWINPAKTDLTSKINEIKKYTQIKGIKGIHLDYLRYPGNAHKTKNGTASITNFVKKVRALNKNILLSCAIMPEEECKYYYGQDVDAWKGTVDFVIPMQYKGNYEAGTNWLASTSKFFSKKITVWSGLQAYKSDEDTTLLSNSELTNDAKTCLNNGTQGVILFRYGLSPNINFSSLQVKNDGDKMSVRTWKEIKWQAKQCKKNVEKDYKIGIYSQWGYYFAKAIVTPYKDIKRNKSLKEAPKPTGSYIKARIPKADYIQLAKDLIWFCEKKGRMRNYLDYKNKKIRARLYIYMFAKVLVYYNEHKKLPNYVDINYKAFYPPKPKATSKKTQSTTSLHSYLTDEGCSGIGQCTGYYCGPNSLQQCFYRLTGIHVDESTIASVAGTTSDGTDHDGLNTAVAWFNNKYNKNIKITWKSFSEVGWSKLQEYIDNGAVFCHLLYRNQWGHYEVPQQVRDDDLRILNSLGDSCGSGTYCGYIETRDKSEQKSYIDGISQKSIAILTQG